MDYVSPAEVISDAVRAAGKKAGLSIGDLLIRGALAGVFPGYATSLALISITQELPAIVDAIIFPVGFVILVLPGLELATGNFALLPMAWMDGRFGTTNGAALGELLRQTAVKKTVGYAAVGGAGWGTAFVKALLCNWMVTLGSLLAFASRSTAGRIPGMWLPITTFFAHGYEHPVVNMFVVPAGMLFGASVSGSQRWIWNQIPVTRALFTGA